jgi:hypothetical protein
MKWLDIKTRERGKRKESLSFILGRVVRKHHKRLT